MYCTGIEVGLTIIGLSSVALDHIFRGTVCKATSVEQKMTYDEFVWFILAEEVRLSCSLQTALFLLCPGAYSQDKSHPTAIEYWFRVLDMDGDGVLSMHELQTFYNEQVRIMALIFIIASYFD
jgi:serine/threonine-protein phosphatase 2A regulatory subunit B''